MPTFETGSTSTWRAAVAVIEPISGAVARRLLLWCRQRACGLKGHELILKTEPTRVSLCCSLCGYDTPGWTCDLTPPRRRFDGDPTRHAARQEGDGHARRS